MPESLIEQLPKIVAEGKKEVEWILERLPGIDLNIARFVNAAIEKDPSKRPSTGDMLLLCSDGLTDMLTDAEI